MLETSDDATITKWGSAWRMPTDAEWTELRENCEWTWATNYNGTGVAGYVVVSKTNGNPIFLPAAGIYFEDNLYCVGYYGNYWSSSLNMNCPSSTWVIVLLTSG